MRLTKTVVERLPLPEKESTPYWDDELSGFGVRIWASGKRSYIVQGRANGRSRRVTIGQHGAPISDTQTLTADKARKLAMSLIADFSKDIDPIIEKQRKTTITVTLRDVCDVYLKERRTAKGGELTLRTKADIKRHIETSFADWADKPVAAITRDLCSSCFSELSVKGPTQANQAFRILRALLNYAREAYRADGVAILPENPVAVLSGKRMWNPNNARNGRIPLDKVGAVWNLLEQKRSADATLSSSKTGADIVIFLMLTGCRWNEAAELTWDRVNLKAKTWHIPNPKNHNEVTLPISAPLLAVLTDRQRIQNSHYVFPSRVNTGNGFVVNVKPTMRDISNIAGLHLSPHDLRRTFMSAGYENKLEQWKLKLVTNHAIQGDVTITNYTETNDLTYLADEVETIAKWIVRQGKIAGGLNVIKRKKGL